MGSDSNDSNGSQPEMDEKIIQIPTLAQRDALRREKEKLERKLAGASEPIINMPPVTKYLMLVMLAIHLIVNYAISPEQAEHIISTFGFVPAHFSEGPISNTDFVTPITHMFLHGSWTHLIMNMFMLAAFGSGIERWIGSRRMLLLFFISGLFGVATHYLLNTNSNFPMIGASGGLSGLFAGAIVMLNRGQREMGGRVGILPFALIWIGLSIGFGMLGGPDGSMIAWAAHVGGFLGGFAILKLMRV